jgi:hypothetical protein
MQFPICPNCWSEERKRTKADYFAFFFDAISASRDGMSETARKTYVKAYSRPQALHTGFVCRAFPQHEKGNAATRGNLVRTPVLHMPSERESGNLRDFVDGLREAGLSHVEGRLTPNSGHYAPDGQPVRSCEF